MKKIEKMKKSEENEEKSGKVQKSEEKWKKWRNLEKNDYKTQISIHMPSEMLDTHTQMAHGKKSWFCRHFSPCYGAALTRERVVGYRNMRPETLEIR